MWSIKSLAYNDDDDDNEGADADEEDDPPKKNQHQHRHQHSSFKDWLTSGTVEFLKLTGGVALTTTGKLVNPPLQLTRMLIPSFIASLVDYIDTVMPQRAKDWVRIFTSSIHHIIRVLRNTPRGIQFRHQLIDIVLQDLIQLLSSDEVQQTILDGMATQVKLSEALQ